MLYYVIYCIVLYCIILYSDYILNCIVLYCIALHRIAFHFTVSYFSKTEPAHDNKQKRSHLCDGERPTHLNRFLRSQNTSKSQAHKPPLGVLRKCFLIFDT